MMKKNLSLLTACTAAFCAAWGTGQNAAQALGYAWVDAGNSAVNFTDPTANPPHSLAAWLYLSGSNSATLHVYAVSGDHTRDVMAYCSNGNVHRWLRAWAAGDMTSTCQPGGTIWWADSEIDDT